MSDGPQEIAPGLYVSSYVGPVGTGSATRKRWQIGTSASYIQLSYEQMCSLRRWFTGRDVPDTWPFPEIVEE